MKRYLNAAFIALAITQPGCATVIGGPLEGTVVDGATGKPIPGAFAIAVTRIRGADMVGSRTSCGDLDIVRTDSAGRYRLAASQSGANSERLVMAYAPGYAHDRVDDQQSVKLDAYKGSGDDRRASFIRYSSLVRCGRIEVIAPKLRALFAAIDEEDRTLRVTGTRRESVGGLSDALRQLEQLGRQEGSQK